jgi:hypothetical protein
MLFGFDTTNVRYIYFFIQRVSATLAYVKIFAAWIEKKVCSSVNIFGCFVYT